MTVSRRFAHHFRRSFFSCLLLGLLSATTVASAQPDPNDQPKALNPPVQNGMPFNLGEWQRMTPQERRVAGRQAVEQTLRGSLTWLGFMDKALQDAVVATALEREAQLENVRDKHRAVTQAVINKATTDEQMTELMNQLQDAIEEADTKREAARNALDEKIHFSQQPRLSAFLALTGVTGEGSSFTSGILGNVMSAMANVAVAQPPVAGNNAPAGNNAAPVPADPAQ